MDKAIVLAAGSDDPKELNKLINKAGVNLNAYYKDGDNFPFERTPLINACASRKHDNVRALLKANADVNKGNLDGRTPLMVASNNNDVKLAKILLEAGADPDIKNHSGISPRDLTEIVANLDLKKHLPPAL